MGQESNSIPAYVVDEPVEVKYPEDDETAEYLPAKITSTDRLSENRVTVTRDETGNTWEGNVSKVRHLSTDPAVRLRFFRAATGELVPKLMGQLDKLPERVKLSTRQLLEKEEEEKVDEKKA